MPGPPPQGHASECHAAGVWRHHLARHARGGDGARSALHDPHALHRRPLHRRRPHRTPRTRRERCALQPPWRVPPLPLGRDGAAGWRVRESCEKQAACGLMPVSGAVGGSSQSQGVDCRSTALLHADERSGGANRRRSVVRSVAGRSSNGRDMGAPEGGAISAERHLGGVPSVRTPSFRASSAQCPLCVAAVPGGRPSTAPTHAAIVPGRAREWGGRASTAQDRSLLAARSAFRASAAWPATARPRPGASALAPSAPRRFGLRTHGRSAAVSRAHTSLSESRRPCASTAASPSARVIAGRPTTRTASAPESAGTLPCVSAWRIYTTPQCSGAPTGRQQPTSVGCGTVRVVA
jgi:hypothetical protein